jgi:hypothetical protein
MIYGNAIFMDVPWETIIKIYRKKMGKRKFRALKEYAKDFIEFLDNGNSLFPNSVQEEHLHSSIYSYFNFIKDELYEKIHSKLDEKGKITDDAIKQTVSEVIKRHHETWEKTDNIPSIPKSYNKNIVIKYGKIIDKAIREVFQKLPITKSLSNQLKKIAANLFSKFPEVIEAGGVSGVVIAGFGEKDTFPSLESFHIEGMVNNKLKYKEYISAKIDIETSASIHPFAQREMVSTFMEGIDPYLRANIEVYLSKIFGEYPEIIADNIKKISNKERKNFKTKLKKVSNEIFKDYQVKMKDYIWNKCVFPVINVVTMLPKDELAAMAESLVNLTSFKRKVTMESETVGGPIDVAVISKGDGFIWIKRKHYFKAELNPQFFANYYREDGK